MPGLTLGPPLSVGNWAENDNDLNVYARYDGPKPGSYSSLPMYPAMGPGPLSIPLDPQGVAKIIKQSGRIPCCFR